MNEPKTMMRSGLRIRGERGHPEVRGALIRYAKWLRKHYEFPIRCPVYLYPTEFLNSQAGGKCSATFFAPYDRADEPYIRIATGDYPDCEHAVGRDDALAGFLCSLSHEVIHYFQWWETGNLTERGVDIKAGKLVDRYALDVDHP